MKTIAQQLNVTDFPFEIRDKQGNVLYLENSNGDWGRMEYDSDGNQIYCEDSEDWNIRGRGSTINITNFRRQ
jgi:hypothetical protein